MVTKTRFYSAVRKNAETMIPNWAKNIYRLELPDKTSELKIFFNAGSLPKQDKTEDVLEKELAFIRLDEAYNALKDPKYTLTDYLRSIQTTVNNTIKNNWMSVVKGMGLFTYLVAGENVIRNIDKKDINSFEYKGLHVLRGIVPAQDPDNTMIVNNKIMEKLHLTDDMVNELVLDVLDSDECEILATRVQSVLFSELGRVSENENCGDDQIQAAITMSKIFSDVNAYVIEAQNENIVPAGLLLSEKRLLEIGQKIKARNYFIILLGENDAFIAVPNDNRENVLDYIKKLAEMFDDKMSESIYYFNGRLGFLFNTDKSWIEK